MKKALFLIIAIVSIAVSSAQIKADTIVNNGDGKVVIIDKRPRTIINKQTIPKESVVNITTPEQQPVVNNYYPIERVVVEEAKYSPMNWLSALFIVGLLAVFVIWLCNRSWGCSHSCNCNGCNKQQPVVNHFHVAGGQAIIDKSMSNYENNTTMTESKEDEEDDDLPSPVMLAAMLASIGKRRDNKAEEPKKESQSPAQ